MGSDMSPVWIFCNHSSDIISESALNFSSAGKGPFMAGKAKKMPKRSNFLGGQAEGVVE